MEDPFLNYFALGLLFFVVIVLVYGIIAIHDIPAKIAEARHHPHADAIYAAGWISLFMLHVLWPFLWIWAMAYRPERGWGFGQKPGEPSSPAAAIAELETIKRRLALIENKVGIEHPLTQPRSGSDLREPAISGTETENAPARANAPVNAELQK
jgi:Protein of unknown function (DUF3302)